MSNLSKNTASMNKFRKQLAAELGDISEIDKKIVTRAVNEGLGFIKSETPVDSGFLRKSWKKTPTRQSGGKTYASIYNTADYAEFVNYGHRIVNRAKETVGFVKGRFMLENGIGFIEKRMRKYFKKELEDIKRKYD